MNPNSSYYLSFNVGYPYKYDRAFGRTGGNIMVHGACTSAGCLSMTDEQIADLYALLREAFAGIDAGFLCDVLGASDADLADPAFDVLKHAGFSAAEITGAVETVVDTYLKNRETADETFLAAYRRRGAALVGGGSPRPQPHRNVQKGVIGVAVRDHHMGGGRCTHPDPGPGEQAGFCRRIPQGQAQSANIQTAFKVRGIVDHDMRHHTPLVTCFVK